MRILITGANGMLGRTLAKVLAGHELLLTDHDTLDITNKNQLWTFFKQNTPDTVIHCAAMTQVDDCEKQPDLAFQINANGTGHLADCAAKLGSRLIAISTDYVFDGELERPYTEFDAATGGKTVYGQSKFAGEELIQALCANYVIARTAYLYGPGGPSFLHTMLKLADGTRSQLSVVNDQIGNPTSTWALAQKLAQIIDHPEISGIVHVTCEGEASWYDFAKAIFAERGIDQKVVPCTTEEFPRPAPRPKNSRLTKKRLQQCGLPPMPTWQEALHDFFVRGEI